MLYLCGELNVWFDSYILLLESLIPSQSDCALCLQDTYFVAVS